MIEGISDTKEDVVIAHNLPCFDVDGMMDAFLTNDTYRKSPAKVRWYHEMLSFSPLDKKHIDNTKLETIAREYIKRRNPNALCFVVSHTDTDHQHLHFCFSGTEYRSRKTLRMDDTVFANLRTGMEQYQLKHFPELKNSIVYLGKEQAKERAVTRDKNARGEREYQAKRRLGKQQMEKERLQTLVKQAYNESQSVDEFCKTIGQSGVTIYKRSGRVEGIISGRKYRFATLGISKAMLKSLHNLERRNQEMEALTGGSSASQDLER